MANYTGIPCVHCGKPFQEGDDVVVCPECGAPHHRSCYQELGHCALLERHGTGRDWQDPTIRPKAVEEDRVCGHCGKANPPQGEFCQYCGSNLNDVEKEGHPPVEHSSAAAPQSGWQSAPVAPPTGESPMATPVGPVVPTEIFDGVTAREIAAYVGRNSRHYLTIFKMMKERGKKYSFSWSAFLFNFCYFFYRKMWKPGILLLAVLGLFFLPKIPYTMETTKYYMGVYLDMPMPYDMALIQSMGGMMQIINLLQFALMTFLALFGNRIYYNHVVRSIKKIKSQLPQGSDQQTVIAALQQKGGVSSFAGYGSAIAVLFIFMAISYQIALRLTL